MTRDTTASPLRDVIVIGAGFAGIGVAVALQDHGITNVQILERASQVGGTWRDNHYPGAACDVPSHLYSFSFRPNPNWSFVFAEQPEILQYLKDTVTQYGLDDAIAFDSEVVSAVWEEEAGAWRVQTLEAVYRSRVLISAVGHLSEPKLPDIPGLDRFAGDIFHSAAWDDAASLEGKRVGVIGTGASAIQIVPAIAEKVGYLSVFQRSAPYITPRPDRRYTDAEKRMFARVPAALQTERTDVFWANEERYAQRRGTAHLVEAITNTALSHLHAQVPPGELRDRLTPDYTIGCKRILKSDDYYPALQLPQVALVTDPIAEVEESGIRTADGTLIEFDVLIAATGFEATDLPIAHRVRGRDDLLLAEHWADGMEAYATTSVHGFPNFWLINGPNTGLGHSSSVYVAEAQIAHIVEAAQTALQGRQVLDVSLHDEQRYTADLDAMSQGTVWMDGGCRSWYVDSRSHRLTTLWPDFAFSFREVNSPFDPAPYGAGPRPDPAGERSPLATLVYNELVS